MKIEFQDDETATVSFPASVVDEQTGDCIEDGHHVYTIHLRVTDDDGNCPLLAGVQYMFAFPANPDRPYSLSLIALGQDPRYRIDTEAPRFSDIIDHVEEEWWNNFAEDYFVYIDGSYDAPAHWRAK